MYTQWTKHPQEGNDCIYISIHVIQIIRFARIVITAHWATGLRMRGKGDNSWFTGCW